VVYSSGSSSKIFRKDLFFLIFLDWIFFISMKR